MHFIQGYTRSLNFLSPSEIRPFQLGLKPFLYHFLLRLTLALVAVSSVLILLVPRIHCADLLLNFNTRFSRSLPEANTQPKQHSPASSFESSFPFVKLFLADTIIAILLYFSLFFTACYHRTFSLVHSVSETVMSGSACCMLHAGLLLGLFFEPEDGCDIFLRNVG
jgi:hypothetical protein